MQDQIHTQLTLAPNDVDSIAVLLAEQLEQNRSFTLTVFPAAPPLVLHVTDDVEPENDAVSRIEPTGREILYRAAARLLHRCEHGMTKEISDVVASEETIDDIIITRPDLIESCDFVSKWNLGGNTRTPFSVFHYAARKATDNDTASNFIWRLATGAELAYRSPELVLRTKIKRHAERGHPLESEELLIMLFNAFNYSQEGVSISKMRTPRTRTLPRLHRAA